MIAAVMTVGIEVRIRCAAQHFDGLSYVLTIHLLSAHSKQLVHWNILY